MKAKVRKKLIKMETEIENLKKRIKDLEIRLEKLEQSFSGVRMYIETEIET